MKGDPEREKKASEANLLQPKSDTTTKYDSKKGSEAQDTRQWWRTNREGPREKDLLDSSNKPRTTRDVERAVLLLVSYNILLILNKWSVVMCCDVQYLMVVVVLIMIWWLETFNCIQRSATSSSAFDVLYSIVIWKCPAISVSIIKYINSVCELDGCDGNEEGWYLAMEVGVKMFASRIIHNW
jgi:hypothetical protein